MNIKYNKDILAIIATLIITSGISFFIPLNFIINFAHDDSFFYLKIAQNIVNGSGITFDNISSTNGFHPLYLISITFLFYVLKMAGVYTSEYQFLTVFIFHIVLIHLIVFIINKILKQILTKEYFKYGILIFILYCLSFVFIRDFGLESHISCLLITVYLLNGLSNKDSGSKITFNVLIVCGLFLSRTDYLFTLIPFIIISDFVLNTNKNRYRALIINITGLLFVVFIYYYINQLIWGYYQTTSSLIVNTFPNSVLWDNLSLIYSLNSKLYNQGARLILFLFIFFMLFSIKNKSKFEISLIYISLGLLSNSLLHLLYNAQGIREWYMTLPSFISGISIVILLRNKKNVTNYLSICTLLILFIFTFYQTRVVSLKWDFALDYAYYIKENTNPGDIIYQYDMSGVLSFFSNRNIINGDGLVNDFNYINYLKDNNIKSYLKNNNVKYLSTINYSDDLFTNEGLYKYRPEESRLDQVILSKSNLCYKHKLVYKHSTGYQYGYFLLFKL